MHSDGFIVDAQTRSVDGADIVSLYGRLSGGDSFCVELDGRGWGFWIRSEDLRRVGALLGSKAMMGSIVLTQRARTVDGAEATRLEWPSVARRRAAFQTLDRAGVRTYEADLSWMQAILLELGVRGSLRIEGAATPGRHVDLQFRNPIITPSDWIPELCTLSIDIETEGVQGDIVAISLSCSHPLAERSTREVLLLGDRVNGADWIRCYRREADLIAAFVERVRMLDPDIILGWNVIDFDLRIIAQRARTLGVALLLGRGSEPSEYLPAWDGDPASLSSIRGGRGRMQARFMIAGRQTIDAMRLVRYGRQQYEDYRLETVARAILHRGKLTQFSKVSRANPLGFARYCLEDAVLAWEIALKSGLLELTLRRCMLTGVPLSRAWGSIAAFDAMYIDELHRRGMVAPTTGIDRPPVEVSAGGGIISPRPGIYSNVLVFDFRSLYPSIIVTFNIDPMTIRSRSEGRETGAWIVAPNGASFSMGEAILPNLLGRFFEQREIAKRNRNEVASFVYKILMNACYGVLGTSACRFGDSRISGAITGFGREILHQCADWFRQMGYQVLYGDTDSIFVLSGRAVDCDAQELLGLGERLCDEINRRVALWLQDRYGVRSQLLLELEKIYDGFLLPPIRTRDGQTTRGRAKGYAGRLLPTQATQEQAIEVVGMEAARHDWTDLAHDFQRTLLQLLFDRAPLDEIHATIAGVRTQLHDGNLDDKLIYRKRIRRPLSAYRSSQPPHVRAARLLPPHLRRGMIRYIITHEGPQPVDIATKPDYRHYLTRQLKPIADSLGLASGLDLVAPLDPDLQPTLF